MPVFAILAKRENPACGSIQILSTLTEFVALGGAMAKGEARYATRTEGAVKEALLALLAVQEERLQQK